MNSVSGFGSVRALGGFLVDAESQVGNDDGYDALAAGVFDCASVVEVSESAGEGPFRGAGVVD